MSSLAPLSFSCCNELVSKMSVKQKRELYHSIISSTDDCDMHWFSSCYKIIPDICQICESSSYIRKHHRYEYCESCNRKVCDGGCYMIYILFDNLNSIFCIDCLSDKENEDLKDESCDAICIGIGTWKCTSCNNECCNMCNAKFTSPQNPNMICRGCARRMCFEK